MTRLQLAHLALFLTLVGLAFAADKPKITLEEFFNAVDFTSVHSPDGNSVVIGAERADWNREIFQTNLWLYRDDGHSGGSLTQLTQSGHDSVPRWSPGGAGLPSRPGAGSRPANGSMRMTIATIRTRNPPRSI